MKTYKINVNNKKYTITCDEEKPLLWVLRDDLKLTGTKYGCGIGQCGACTIHIANNPVRACKFPISLVEDEAIITIEGLDKTHREAILKAYEKFNVPQCGYCHAGQIMSAIALLKNSKTLSDGAIDNAMSGNICRCGTYYRIKKAIKEVSLSKF